MEIRNIAIIAHVDHGKTTLVDALLKAGGAFLEHQHIEERVMDSFDQEKERGITIYAKNAAVMYNGTKINIIDTPGHADFGSEVERTLQMVDAVLLVVDAYEGPMPQTKFVLSKSLQQNKKVLVLINKIDKPTARPKEVVDMIFDLFVSLGASDQQLEFPYMYAIARDGIAIKSLTDTHKDITPLFDFIIEHTPPVVSITENVPCLLQPATLHYDSFIGRIAIARIHQGVLKKNDFVHIIDSNNKKRTGRISKLFTFEGLQKKEVESASAGDIIAFAGISDIMVGETVSTSDTALAMPTIQIDPPSLAMNFLVNDSPFMGKEGKFITSRHIRDRLMKELETNVGLHIEATAGSDTIKVYGRGEMHLAVLIETMRREGFELQVSQPEVVMETRNGVVYEPLETAVVQCPESIAGKVIELFSLRRGEMTYMNTENNMTALEFIIPTRGLLGIRNNFTILTRGEGILYSSFLRKDVYRGVIEKRQVGSLISGETGTALAYALWNLQERGALFIHPATEVYEGMIIGEHNQGTDLTVNPLKGKKLTNMRASGSDDAINLTPPRIMTLERAMEYIKEDEYVEITPKSIRMRKKYLTELDRKRNG